MSEMLRNDGKYFKKSDELNLWICQVLVSSRCSR